MNAKVKNIMHYVALMGYGAVIGLLIIYMMKDEPVSPALPLAWVTLSLNQYIDEHKNKEKK